MPQTRDDIDRMQRQEQQDRERAMDRREERRTTNRGNHAELTKGEERQESGAMKERKGP